MASHVRVTEAEHFTVAAKPTHVAFFNLETPPGFATVLNDFAKQVLFLQPEDITKFGAEYFEEKRNNSGNYFGIYQDTVLGGEPAKPSQSEEDASEGSDVFDEEEAARFYKNSNQKKERRASGMFPNVFYDPTVPKEMDETMKGCSFVQVSDVDSAASKIQANFKGMMARKDYNRKLSLIQEQRSHEHSVIASSHDTMQAESIPE